MAVLVRPATVNHHLSSQTASFNSAFEPWCDWRRFPPPGYMFLYTYWMDMKRDPDGHYWGNMLGPAAAGEESGTGSLIGA